MKADGTPLPDCDSDLFLLALAVFVWGAVKTVADRHLRPVPAKILGGSGLSR
jgi:hypothetical protein